MFGRTLFASALLVAPAFAASPQPEEFKRLTGPQIRKAFTGKLFSDSVHFSYRFAASGRLQSTQMGKTAINNWSVSKNQLCIHDQFGENCYDVWINGNTAKFTIDGPAPFLEGVLK